MRVLVTRPLPDGERTATALRARGYDVLVAPLMQVTPVAADLTGRWSAVIVTSANAMRAPSREQLAPLTMLPLFAVGQRSAEAAREAGFSAVHSADGDAGDLILMVAARHGNQSAPYLYLAGEDRAADIEAELANRNITARTVIVYKNVTTAFPDELVRALKAGALDAVLHFSRRSAENYVSGANDAGLLPAALKTRHVCISPQVAEPLQAAGARDIALAARPDETGLFALLPPQRP